MHIPASRSIRFRLAAWYAGITLTIFAFAGVFLILAVRSAAEQTVDAELEARLAAVRENVPADLTKGVDDHLSGELDEQVATGPPGAWVQVADDGGRWLYRSDAIKCHLQQPPSHEQLRPGGRAETTTLYGKPFRILTAPTRGGVVQLGSPMGQVSDLLRKLKSTLLIACPLLLILASGGGYWMSGRALKPVDDIAVTVERINSENLTERLQVRGTGDELDRLSSLINQMLERLESAFRRVTQFTADASHELRTPVAIIRSTGEVMQKSVGTLHEHQTEWLEVERQALRMSALVDDLLLLARTDARPSGLAVESMDLADVAREAVNEASILPNASLRKLTASIPARCPMTGSPEAMRRILLALLDNAIKYTGAGGEITLRTGLSPETRSAIVEVFDTGIGIPADDLPHVFDRFYRVSADRSRQSGGTGLGLSIAKSLAMMHGGDIEAESVPGSGSVFRLIVPLS
jgi:signal transduction histidine kinase